MGGCFNKEGHETQFDAMGLFKYILVLITHRNHGTHIDLIEGRQDRIVCLGLEQALRNPRAQTTHRYALFWTLAHRHSNSR